MPLPLFQVDAFTSRPFGGNPAAVCVLDTTRDDGWMQSVAAEMNLSETAFLLPEADGFRLRWFTPAVEVDLCGHATLASAHILWTEHYLPQSRVARFYTASGLLTATWHSGWIELDFPTTPVTACKPPADLLDALGVTPLFVGRTQFDYLVEIATPDQVLALEPDLIGLRAIDTRGVIVTSKGAPASRSRAKARERHVRPDFVSRFFAPGAGIDEDPVTGSAHCALGHYWAERLGLEDFTAEQLSARGGTVRVRLDGERVKLCGQAVTILRGEIGG